jgi:hypothetical protein
MRESPLRKTWEYSNITPGMPGRSYQTKPGLPSACQVNIKCFYAKSTCLGSNYRNISSLTLVIPGYLQRTVDNYSRAYLWLISHDLSHGVPLMYSEINEEKPGLDLYVSITFDLLKTIL